MPSTDPLKNLPTEVADRLIGAPPAQIQEITLSKIAEYRAQIADHHAPIADYSAQIEQLQVYIHNLHIIHNSATPLHAKMPPEILMHIFSYLRPKSIRDLRFTHVCHTWRVLLRRVPEFWREMVSVINMDELNLVAAESLIQLSAPLPLSLKFKRVYSSKLSVLTDPKSMGTRLSSLSLWMRDLHDMDRFLGLDLPSLKNLSILIARRCAVSITQAFSCFCDTPPSQRLPRLHSLTVQGHLFIPPLGVPSLKRLVIIQPTSRAAFAESLKSCSDLQSLTLRGCFDILWTSPGLGPIDLPNLRNMNILDGRAWVHEQYLDCITYPPTTHLTRITGSAPIQDVFPISLLSMLSPASRLVVRWMSSVRKGHLMLTMHGYLTEGLSRLTMQSDLQAEYGDRWHRRGFSDLYNALIFVMETNETVRHLEWHLDHGRGLHMSEEQWTSLLGAFESLYSLVVHVDNCRTLFRALRVPSVAPHLRELEVVCRFGSGAHETIVRGVEAREASGLGLTRFAITTMPKSEDSTHRKLSAARLARLKAAVQNVSVIEG